RIDVASNLISVRIIDEQHFHVPDSIFDKTVTSNNYDEWYGANLVNIYLSEFTIETTDGKRKNETANGERKNVLMRYGANLVNIYLSEIIIETADGKRKNETANGERKNMLMGYGANLDLWRECIVYGTVVDVYIPFKKSKAGKSFAFVRFIKVLFDRPHKTSSQKPNFPSLNGKTRNPDDDCITERDFSKCAMGKVKDFNSILILRVILGEEGFKYVNVFYLGGKWVMFEFEMGETKVNMMKHIRVNSWFQVIQDVIQDFISDEHVVWVDIEGIPLHAWSRETFTKIGKK
nr:UvrD-like helicase, ATP-binding domain, P-loop containing nucleoside triphosphate hydrolase [Tanacetum cinerariifolium]